MAPGLQSPLLGQVESSVYCQVNLPVTQILREGKWARRRIHYLSSDLKHSLKKKTHRISVKIMFLEKFIVAHLIKNFTAYNGTRNLLPGLKDASTGPYLEYTHFLFLRYILILTSHLCLDLPHIRFLVVYLIFPVHRFNYANKILWRIQMNDGPC